MKAHEILEADPTGRDAHSPGAKLDQGKLRVDLVLGSFARALEAVAAVGTDGAVKYSPDGWLQVPDAIERYSDAEGRHKLELWKGEERDPATGHKHRAHQVWNALAVLELELRGEAAAVERSTQAIV